MDTEDDPIRIEQIKSALKLLKLSHGLGEQTDEDLDLIEAGIVDLLEGRGYISNNDYAVNLQTGEFI